MEYDACALAEIGDGGKKVVSVGEAKVLLLRKGEEVWAVDAKCPHMNLPLSPGKWDGEILKCRFHGACYNVADGSRVKPPWLLASMGSDTLPTYPVTIKDGRIFVETAGSQ
ncbi:MAG: Rieske 2Fe-2S domain-containing protein [Deltaproteobacteria bacterium]|nr:Rieske 2Fe-2S domain-containing protein [Deltaproteobacteria bacterium]MBW2726014.1 Rieske 2Fe-2S domain-containing protein [Deltaproteobacteria bacterium]